MPRPPPSGSARVVLAAHVGAALSLGHSHADQQRSLLRHGQRARIVVARQQARNPVARDRRERRRSAREHRNAGERHRQRALRAVLDLRMQMVFRCPSDLRAGDAERSTARSARPRRRRSASAHARPDGTRSHRSARRARSCVRSAEDCDWRRRRARTFRHGRVAVPTRRIVSREAPPPSRASASLQRRVVGKQVAVRVRRRLVRERRGHRVAHDAMLHAAADISRGALRPL